MNSVTADRAPRYGLGHSGRELERLQAQARIIGPITRQFFQAAGLAPGMRVLDVGCGVGDVAFLAAELVGESGEVVGIDRAEAALEVARARAEAEARRNVFFRQGDPTETRFGRPFDAVIGRYVLEFQPDPAAVLRKLAAHLRPGGLIVFHEHDWQTAQSFPPSPLYDTCYRWISETLGRLGTDLRVGIKLHLAFTAAGLPAPSMMLRAVIGGGENTEECLRLAADPVRTLAPEMIRLGIATEAEIGLETLFERMRDEVLASGSVLVGRAEIGAWARI